MYNVELDFCIQKNRLYRFVKSGQVINAEDICHISVLKVGQHLKPPGGAELRPLSVQVCSKSLRCRLGISSGLNVLFRSRGVFISTFPTLVFRSLFSLPFFKLGFSFSKYALMLLLKTPSKMGSIRLTQKAKIALL